MITASPHLYRSAGKKAGIPSEIVERALTQAIPPEKRGLPAILTLRHLAHLTGAGYKYLRAIAARSDEGYRTFVIKKRNGRGRLIAAPQPILAAVQRWIVDNVLNKRDVHSASYAYSPESSPAKCAAQHLGARWLVKLDIHDFFESINERRIYYIFRECGYQPLVSFELARICTRGTERGTEPFQQWQIERHRLPPGLKAYRTRKMGHLPQGAPTSPMLSNLASFGLDELLTKIAGKYGLIYTRYSDDVVFSTGNDFSHKEAAGLLCDASRAFTAFGHQPHREKLVVAPPGSRRTVLGLLVDGESLRLRPEFKDRLSNHVRGIEKFGVVEHANHRHFSSIWGLVRHLDGSLVYANTVEPNYAAPLRNRLLETLKDQGWAHAMQLSAAPH